MAFLGISIQLFQKIYCQHVRNAILAVCAKPVPVWGKRGEMKGLLREENYFDMASATKCDERISHSKLLLLFDTDKRSCI